MCLAFKKSQRATRKVATKDITIYKMVNKSDKGMFTMFQNAHVELGTLYSVQLQQPYKGDFNHGNLLCRVDTLLMDNRADCMFVSRGLHAFTNACFKKKELFNSYVRELFGYDTIVLKGRIPAGSEYYENKLIGLIVSSAMVYDEEVVINY